MVWLNVSVSLRVPPEVGCLEDERLLDDEFLSEPSSRSCVLSIHTIDWRYLFVLIQPSHAEVLRSKSLEAG